MPEHAAPGETTFRGIPVSAGVCMGKALVLGQQRPQVTRQTVAEHSPIVASKIPLLAKALPFVGHAPTRNRGTLGGSIAFADPASEFPAVALALNARIEASGEKTFPNARNATAGTLKQLDPSLVAQRPLRAVFYAVGACEGIAFATHTETLQALRRMGLPTQRLWWSSAISTACGARRRKTFKGASCFCRR